MSNKLKQLENLLDNLQIVDLSYQLEVDMPSWPTQARYGRTKYESYEFGDLAIHYLIMMSEHTGTHIDAPYHFIPEGKSVEKLNLKQLIGPAIKINAVNLGKKELLTVEQIKKHERDEGEIKPGDSIFIRFGWDKKWDIQPNCRDFLNDWPGLSQKAAEYLVKKNVSLVGCDTLSLDVYGSEECPAHYQLLGNEIPIIENLNKLSLLPNRFYIFCLPMKLKEGSGSPIRVIALFDK